MMRQLHIVLAISLVAACTESPETPKRIGAVESLTQPAARQPDAPLLAQDEA